MTDDVVKDPLARRFAYAAFAAGLACLTGADDVLRAQAPEVVAAVGAISMLVVARLS